VLNRRVDPVLPFLLKIENECSFDIRLVVGAHETIVSENWPNMPGFALRFYSRMLSVVKGNDAGLKGF
jgi:hypothetical protein